MEIDQKKQFTLKVDLKDVGNMRCYCGSDIFLRIYNLKYLSPFLTGNPKPMTATIEYFRCILCGQVYQEAVEQKTVEKLYNGLPKNRRAFVDEIKAKYEAQKALQEKDRANIQ